MTSRFPPLLAGRERWYPGAACTIVNRYTLHRRRAAGRLVSVFITSRMIDTFRTLPSMFKRTIRAHTRLPSVGFGADPGSWQSACTPKGDVSHKPCYQFCCLVNRGTMGVNSLPKTVTRQRRDCDLNPGASAPESSTLTTRLPSHPHRLIW